MRPGFHLFPQHAPSFPAELVAEFERRTGRGILGNRAASGTAIIAELGPEQARTGAWIAYTSGDSVFQLAAHNDVIPLAELYRACEVARELCNPYRVGRVIARPFTGRPGAYVRTEDRRDYAYRPPEPTVLEHLTAPGCRSMPSARLRTSIFTAGLRNPCTPATTIPRRRRWRSSRAAGRMG